MPSWLHLLMKYSDYKDIALALSVKDGMFLVVMAAYIGGNFRALVPHQWGL